MEDVVGWAASSISAKCRLSRDGTRTTAKMNVTDPDRDQMSRDGSCEVEHDTGDLGEMLEELRILLPGSQLLTAFLITLPFSAGFAKISQTEKWVFMATFLCSLTSLVFFSAPAAQHRLLRPLKHRARFKQFATRQALIGSVALALALVLGTHLVLAEVFAGWLGMGVAALFACLIAIVWWLLPRALRGRGRF